MRKSCKYLTRHNVRICQLLFGRAEKREVNMLDLHTAYIRNSVYWKKGTAYHKCLALNALCHNNDSSANNNNNNKTRSIICVSFTHSSDHVSCQRRQKKKSCRIQQFLTRKSSTSNCEIFSKSLRLLLLLSCIAVQLVQQ